MLYCLYNVINSSIVQYNYTIRIVTISLLEREFATKSSNVSDVTVEVVT